MFTILLLPVIQSFNLSTSVGVELKGLKIAVKSEEINLVDCRYYNNDGCIFDKNSTQTQSCIVINYLETLGYTMVCKVKN